MGAVLWIRVREAREREGSRLWHRRGEAREAAHIAAETFYNGVLEWGRDDEEIELMLVRESGGIPADTWLDEPFFDSAEDLRTAAAALHCTTDYLLGVSDEPHPSGTGRWRCVADGELPDEGQAVIVLNRFTQGAAWSCNTSVYHNDAFRFTEYLDMELCGVQYWLPSPELPE